MADKSSITVGLLAIATALVVLPASVALVRDSMEERQTIAVLHAPKTFEIRGSHILDAAMYDTEQALIESTDKALQLVSIIAGRPDAEALLRLWDAVKTEALIRRADMRVVLCQVGAELALENLPTDVAVTRVTDPRRFSNRTGIRVLPFSLVIAGGGNVLAAGPGLPDLAFVHDAAERFILEGPSATTKFRRVTPEVNSSLTVVETLFPASPSVR